MIHDVAIAIRRMQRDDKITRAMTVVDWYGLWGRPHNAEVLTVIDPERFVALLVERLASVATRAGRG